jgi:hypothetical protein
VRGVAPICGAVGLHLASPAHAIEAGVGLGVRTELNDGSSGDAALKFGPGPIVWVPVRIPLAEGFFLRGDLQLGGNGGQDRVEWQRLDSMVTVYSDTHWTLLTEAGLSVGPELSLFENGSTRVLWGVTGGVNTSASWHSFDSTAVDVFDPEKNDLDNPMNIDPYTLQASPAVGTHASLLIETRSALAFELEVGYKVSTLREAPLRKADADVNAVRSAMGLNFFRLGVSVIWGRESGVEG